MTSSASEETDVSEESEPEGTMSYGTEPGPPEGPGVTSPNVIAAALKDAPVAALGPIDQLRHRDLRQDIRLKKRVSKWALWSTAAVLGFSCLVVLLYVIAEWDHIDSAVMIAWFSAAVVQTLGIMYIIARYLFPGRGGQSA